MIAFITRQGGAMKKVFTILAILMLFASGNAYAIPQIEREALIAFYESTLGDRWNQNDGWKTPPLDTDGFAMPGTECDWYGVTCQEERLTPVNLSYNQLTGVIPPKLGNCLSVIISCLPRAC
jgi:hypothetical protein